MKTFEFNSNVDGWPIQGYRWNVDYGKAVVVVSHGMAEHALRYDRFANELNDTGFDVWAVDHRAHGKTSGPEGLGDFGEGGWDALVDDLGQLVDLAHAANPNIPVVLFGHSMGAAAAQHYVPQGSHKLQALVLSGTTLRDPGAPVEPYNIVFESPRTAYDWLSRDEAEVDKYIADPLCGFEGQKVKNGFDRSDSRRVDPQRLAKIRSDLPVLLVAGDADPVNQGLKGIDYLEQKWREAGVQKIDRQIYAGGRHEMLNETNRAEVSANIINWLDSTLAS